MYVDILNLPDLKQYDLKSLSTGIMAGAPCPEEIAKGTIKDLNMKDFAVGSRDKPAILSTSLKCFCFF
jgi:fatty-acyl-CoA synthase